MFIALELSPRPETLAGPPDHDGRHTARVIELGGIGDVDLVGGFQAEDGVVDDCAR
jgi:hypothetical protein